MDIEAGNANGLDTQGTGWFIGFSPWTWMGASGLRHVPQGQALNGLCVKWFDHPGDHSGDGKPVSEGRTISLLVSPEASFTIEFSPTPDFAHERLRRYVLRKAGDYVAWGPGLFHRWHCERRATILTIRWNSAE